jgi:hypothetical protein
MRHVGFDRQEEGCVFIAGEELNLNRLPTTELCRTHTVQTVDHPHGRPMDDDRWKRVGNFGKPPRVFRVLTGKTG